MKMPAKDHDPIVVVLSADDNYAMQMAVAAVSIAVNHKKPRELLLFLIDGGISIEKKGKIMRSLDAQKARVEWIVSNDPAVGRLRDCGHISKTAYNVMLIPDLLPDSFRKAIYLDVDLIALGDVEDLWDLPVEPFHFLAAQDAIIPFVSSELGLTNFKELGLAPKTKYLNGGVMVFDLARWRGDRLGQRTLDYTAQNIETVRWAYQDGLNALFHRTWGELDKKWNYQPHHIDGGKWWKRQIDCSLDRKGQDLARKRMLGDKPSIVHFATHLKPWLPGCKHPAKSAFFHYLDRTAWGSSHSISENTPSGSLALSVVIPTYNRKNKLPRVLDALKSQIPHVAGGAEVVVVDDGSRDGTFESLAERVRQGGFRVFRQANQGPAAARNRGAREARGGLLLFLDDDMIPQPCLLQAHIEAHEDPNEALAILGHAQWEVQRMGESRFYRLLDNGLYFIYSLMMDPQDLTHAFMWSCNLSLPRRSFLEHGGFDTDFPRAVSEDIEFGYRAIVVGRPGIRRLRLAYCPYARTLHDKPIDITAYMAMIRQNRDTWILLKKHPELAQDLAVDVSRATPLEKPISIALKEILARLSLVLPLPIPSRYYYDLKIWAFLQGVKEGQDIISDFRLVEDYTPAR